MENITLRKVLELAVTTEEMGGQYYRDLAKKFAGETAVAEIFEKLAMDEDGHETQFRALLQGVDQDKELSAADDAYHLLWAASSTVFFDKATFKDLESVKTPAEALHKALEFEKSTLFYYQQAREAIGPSDELDKLIAAEKGHVTALMRVILSDAKFRSLGDPWA